MFDTLPNSPPAFYHSILTSSIAALKLNTYFDNFDAARFNHDGVDRSRNFNAQERAYFFDWFIKNSEALFSAYSSLGDDESKRLYLHLIAYRLAGHFSVRIPVHFEAAGPALEEYKAAEKSVPSELVTNGMFGQLRHFDFVFRDARYVVDCLGLESYLYRGQYFYVRDGAAISPVEGDTVIDGGACTGDTAAVFSNTVGAKGRVYCFDPVADHLTILKHNAEQFVHRNVTVMPYGLSDRNIFAQPIVLGGYAPGFSSGKHQVPLRSIDFLVKSHEVERINFIKLDIEGAELACLSGARESIARFKPKLAISLYHKPNDLFEIILMITREFPFYSCHLDHYTIHAEETVLYCRA